MVYFLGERFTIVVEDTIEGVIFADVRHSHIVHCFGYLCSCHGAVSVVECIEALHEESTIDEDGDLSWWCLLFFYSSFLGLITKKMLKGRHIHYQE